MYIWQIQRFMEERMLIDALGKEPQKTGHYTATEHVHEGKQHPS